MYGYYLENVWELFYTKSLEKDKIEFQKFKAQEIIIWKKRSKIINFILSIVTVMLIVTSIIYFSRLAFDDFFYLVLIIFLSFAVNNIEPKDYKIWNKFILRKIANQMSNHIQHEDGNESIDGYDKLNWEQKSYFIVRDYIFDKSNFTSVGIRQLIDHLINYKAKKGEFRNAKYQQYRRDEYHYSAIVNEMNLRRPNDHKVVFSGTSTIGSIFKFWILISILAALVIIFFNGQTFHLDESMAIALIMVWILIFVTFFITMDIYGDSKYLAIKLWEKYFISQGWDIFERPGVLFTDWGTLDKYATFYFQKAFADNIADN